MVTNSRRKTNGKDNSDQTIGTFDTARIDQKLDEVFDTLGTDEMKSQYLMKPFERPSLWERDDDNQDSLVEDINHDLNEFEGRIGRKVEDISSGEESSCSSDYDGNAE